MKRIGMVVAGTLCVSAALGDLAEYVDPFVGTAGTGHTTPAACVPFGLVQAGSDTGFGDWEHCSGYIYGDKTICGFTQTHLNGTGCPDLGDVRILLLQKEKVKSKSEQVRVGIPFDKASERAEPGYYAVTLKDPAVRVEIAAAEHSAIYRFMPEEAGEIRLAVEPKALFYNPPEFPERSRQALAFDVVRNETGGVIGLSGAYQTICWVTRDVGYCVEFDRAGRCDGVDAYAFDLKVGEALMLKVGLAAGNGGLIETALPERAKKNLETEIPGWDFDAVKNAARQKWNVVLSRAVIEGTDDQKKNWYTSLYHLCVQPNNIADVGEKPFYSTFSCWDTFRAAGPLYTILYPEKATERIREVFDKFYLPKPDGLCGNDDCGQMSAWYLFSAMGFYPFNPCGGEYVIGAPQVPTAQVKVGGVIERSEIAEGLREQRTFRVLAKGLSKENKYVKTVTLNGKPITDWKIRHEDIVKGGELVFEMGN